MSSSACRRRSAALLARRGALAALLAAPAAAAPKLDGYSGYTTAVTGSIRTVAMAGAFVASPDSYAATFTNPAGLSITSRLTDFAILAQNNVKDIVIDLDTRQQKKLNRSLTYIYSGISHRFRSGWGAGITYATPFAVSRLYPRNITSSGVVVANETHEADISINTLTLAAAKDVWKDRLAVGVGVNLWIFDEGYRFTTTDPSGIFANDRRKPRVQSGFERQVFKYAVSPHAGILWRATPWLQAGVAAHAPVSATYDPVTYDADLPFQVTWFRDVRVPARVAAGAAFFLHPRWQVHVESNYVMSTESAILVGESFFGVKKGFPEGRVDVIDGRWGTELTLMRRRNVKSWLWGGGYYETTRTEGSFARYHSTVGAEVDPWILKISAAYDTAQLYENFAFGIGADIRRILGWTGIKM